MNVAHHSKSFSFPILDLPKKYRISVLSFFGIFFLQQSLHFKFRVLRLVLMGIFKHVLLEIGEASSLIGKGVNIEAFNRSTQFRCEIVHD